MYYRFSPCLFFLPVEKEGADKMSQRVTAWLVVAVYTIALPHAYLVYQFINERTFPTIVKGVPGVLIVIMTIVFIIYCVRKKKTFHLARMMFISAIIIGAIVYFEDNFNKHIHIPEYIIMSWLLFRALSMDYNGKGIYILIVVCGLFLGIFDELQQGIHPHRYYGRSDMRVNGASVLIGVLGISHLVKRPVGDWKWLNHLKKMKGHLIVILLGAIGLLFSCEFLFRVTAAKTFSGVYPAWLTGWNILFPIGGVVQFVLRPKQQPQIKTRAQMQNAITAWLWIIVPVSILSFMHLFIVFIVFSGIDFK